MFNRLLSVFSQFGVGPGIVYLADRALGAVSSNWRVRFYELMVQPIPDRSLLSPGLVKNLSYRQIRDGDPALDLMPAPFHVRTARFAQGSVCLGMFRKDQLIGYSWFTFVRYAEDEARCDFELESPSDSAFDFDLYLFPEHRLGIGFAGLWHGVNDYLRARGIRYTFSRLNRFNLPSRRAHQHLGWKRVGRAFVVQVAGVEFIISGLPPYVWLSLTTGSRMRLRLAPDVLRTKGQSIPAASARTQG